MSKRSAIIPVVLVLAGCASPALVNTASAPDGAVHRVICRAKLDCPAQATLICPGGYRVVESGSDVIGSLNDMRVACL
jgi:hypothetical protein